MRKLCIKVFIFSPFILIIFFGCDQVYFKFFVDLFVLKYCYYIKIVNYN